MAANESAYEAIVIGGSSGAFQALTILLPSFPANFPAAIIVVCHRMPSKEDFLAQYMGTLCQMRVEEAEYLLPIKSHTIYIAPAGYHLFVGEDHRFNLSIDPPVNYSRPSLDVTFESAADVYRNKLIGVILTGSNADGAIGLKSIKAKGGLTVVQDPKTAQAETMPDAAIIATNIDFMGSVEAIALYLCQLFHVEVSNHGNRH